MLGVEDLLAKPCDSELVAELLGFAGEWRMVLAVGSKTGAPWVARRAAWLMQRNDYRSPF